uniref:uncharacterized protein LOC122583164 n=1 Tax=Erigeron canadensis TaxID=72917 RepID=UPI001CB919F7|nr:uncharacterized protein LOC122583164 [Erigeron canadensis]
MLGAHGGDGDGRDPHRSWWKKISGCKNSGSKKTPPPPRGAAKNLKLEAALKKNGGPLPMYFDYKSKTFQSIGDYGAMYKSLLGSLIGDVPQYYESWDDVPESMRDHILEEVQRYFVMDQYLELDEDDPTRKAAKLAFRADAASIYRQRKSKFKSQHFTARGGVGSADTLQTAPPTGMDPEEWGKLLSFYTRDDRVKRAETNKTNRSKQAVGTQGRRSISLAHDRALAKHHNEKKEGPPPTWESTWAATHRLQPPEVAVYT